MLEIEKYFCSNKPSHHKSLFVDTCEKQGFKPMSSKSLDDKIYNYFLFDGRDLSGTDPKPIGKREVTAKTFADTYQAVNLCQGEPSNFEPVDYPMTSGVEFCDLIVELTKYGNKIVPPYDYEAHKAKHKPKPAMPLYIKVNQSELFNYLPDNLYYIVEDGSFEPVAELWQLAENRENLYHLVSDDIVKN